MAVALSLHRRQGTAMKKTPLYQWHKENDANMAEFGSYLMPLWYPQGVKREHCGVIESAGIFDTSHMAAVILEGSGCRELLQETFTKDLDRCLGRKKVPLHDNRCVYGIFLKENGYTLDDAIVYQVEENRYMVVVNAGMGGQLCTHLKKYQQNLDVNITDLTDALGKIDIQGPRSALILAEILEQPDKVLAKMAYFSFKGWFEWGEREAVMLKDGTPVLLSRTGYTGEFGFEIFFHPDRLVDVWQMLLDKGGENIVPCGLAARDSLRAGAVLPLSHQDIGEWPFSNNPWTFALPFDDEGEFSKKFIGSKALQENPAAFHTYAFAGFSPRKITPGEHSKVLDAAGNHLGDILTCTTDMAIDRVDDTIVSMASGRQDGRPENFKPRGLSCGFIKVEQHLPVGERVILTDGKHKVEVEVRSDVRPARTARKPLIEMMEKPGGEQQ